MKTNSYANQGFLETVKLLPHNVFEYVKIDALEAELLTEKAVLLLFNLDKEKKSNWIPFSQLRKDNNNEIWLSKWWLQNKILNSKND
jgi:hypothetical protein